MKKNIIIGLLTVIIIILSIFLFLEKNKECEIKEEQNEEKVVTSTTIEKNDSTTKEVSTTIVPTEEEKALIGIYKGEVTVSSEMNITEYIRLYKDNKFTLVSSSMGEEHFLGTYSVKNKELILSIDWIGSAQGDATSRINDIKYKVNEDGTLTALSNNAVGDKTLILSKTEITESTPGLIQLTYPNPVN